MEINTKISIFILAIFFFLIVLRLVRNKDIRPGATLLWILVSLFLISISVFEPFYRFLSVDVIGFIDSRHSVYIVLIGFLLLYSLYLTVKVTSLTNNVRCLIKEQALLEFEFRREEDES